MANQNIMTGKNGGKDIKEVVGWFVFTIFATFLCQIRLNNSSKLKIKQKLFRR